MASFGSATIFGAPIYETFTKGDTNTKIVAGVLIVLMTATTFITQRQLMVRNMPAGQSNPMAQQQKILLYVFPAMFAVFGINFPIGVLIYWFTTNLWTMGQQLVALRGAPTPGGPPPGRPGPPPRGGPHPGGGAGDREPLRPHPTGPPPAREAIEPPDR